MSEKNAGHYVGLLADAVKGKRVTFTPSLRGRYGREFKTAIQIDKTPARYLEAAVSRIAAVWDDKQLSVTHAVADIERHTMTSQSAEERIRGYEYLFDLSTRQEVMLKLLNEKGWAAVIDMIRDHPEELKDYLEEKV